MVMYGKRKMARNTPATQGLGEKRFTPAYGKSAESAEKILERPRLATHLGVKRFNSEDPSHDFANQRTQLARER
jgi:hypothetical protein